MEPQEVSHEGLVSNNTTNTARVDNEITPEAPPVYFNPKVDLLAQRRANRPITDVPMASSNY